MSEKPASPWFIEKIAREELTRRAFEKPRHDWLLLVLYILFVEGIIGFMYLMSIKT